MPHDQFHTTNIMTIAYNSSTNYIIYFIQAFYITVLKFFFSSKQESFKVLLFFLFSYANSISLRQFIPGLYINLKNGDRRTKSRQRQGFQTDVNPFKIIIKNMNVKRKKIKVFSLEFDIFLRATLSCSTIISQTQGKPATLQLRIFDSAK